MSLEIRLEQARQEYVRFFRQSIQRLKAESEFVTIELLILPNGATNPVPFSLIRIDVATGDVANFKPYRLAGSVTPALGLCEYRLNGLDIVVDPFSWESLVMTFSSTGFAIESLRPWLTRWLDEAKREPDEFGLQGVIHSIGWRQVTNGIWELEFDLGSAPVIAVVELLALLRASGAAEVAFGPNENEA